MPSSDSQTFLRELEPVASAYNRRTMRCRIASSQRRDPRANLLRTTNQKSSDNRLPTLPLQIDQANPAGLIDLVATIPFNVFLYAPSRPLSLCG